MKKPLLMLATLAAGLAAAAPASAHSWDDRGFGGYGYRDAAFAGVCSGNRAERLEDRIERADRNGAISRFAARDLRRAINRVQDDQRFACRRGDPRLIRDIAVRLDGIGYRLERAVYADNRWNGRFDDRRDFRDDRRF